MKVKQVILNERSQGKRSTSVLLVQRVQAHLPFLFPSHPTSLPLVNVIGRLCLIPYKCSVIKRKNKKTNNSVLTSLSKFPHKQMFLCFFIILYIWDMSFPMSRIYSSGKGRIDNLFSSYLDSHMFW